MTEQILVAMDQNARSLRRRAELSQFELAGGGLLMLPIERQPRKKKLEPKKERLLAPHRLMPSADAAALVV